MLHQLANRIGAGPGSTVDLFSYALPFQVLFLRIFRVRRHLGQGRRHLVNKSVEFALRAPSGVAPSVDAIQIAIQTSLYGNTVG